MPRACNLRDDRQLELFKLWFKETFHREPTAEECISDFKIWNAGYHAGFQRCADAQLDDWPD